MVSFFLMTLKGFSVIEDVVSKFGKDFIDFVVSERDSNIEKDYYDEIEAFCLAQGITFYNRKDEFNAPSRYSICVSWRWLINGSTSEIIVLHDSLLPAYRGFNPLVTALINGDDTIGVTGLYATAEFDAGDIIYQSQIKIEYPIKINTAIDNILLCYLEIVSFIISNLLSNVPLPFIKQDNSKATYSLWRDEKDYEIDWNQSADYIKRFIDALGFPYKGAKTYVEGNELRILDAEVGTDLTISNRTAGKIIYIKDDMPYVVCGNGILKIVSMLDRNNNLTTFKKTRIRLG